MCAVRESGRPQVRRGPGRRVYQNGTLVGGGLFLRLVEVGLVKAALEDLRQLIQQFVVLHFLQLLLAVFLYHLEDVVGLGFGGDLLRVLLGGDGDLLEKKMRS